jgi:hypothetical protein
LDGQFWCPEKVARTLAQTVGCQNGDVSVLAQQVAYDLIQAVIPGGRNLSN